MAEAKTASGAAAKKAAPKAPRPPQKPRTKDTAGNVKGPKQTPRTPKPRGQRKTRIGFVVSDKMQKTIVVELEDRRRHPLYGKIIRTTKKVKAHDEHGDAGVGDRVSLMETRRSRRPSVGGSSRSWKRPSKRPSRSQSPRNHRVVGAFASRHRPLPLRV